MPNRFLTLFILTALLSVTLAAAPGGKVTLPKDKIEGWFYAMPESGIDWPRSGTDLYDCRMKYDEEFEGLSKQGITANMRNFPTRRTWNSPGDEASIAGGELLAFFNHDLTISGAKPMSVADAKAVLSTELLYLVGWHGPHGADYVKQIVSNRDVRYVFLGGTRRYPLLADGIREIAKARDLAGMGLSGEGVTDAGVVEAFCDALKKHRKTLRYLYIESLSPVMLPYLAELKKLETLQVVGMADGTWTEAQAMEWQGVLSGQTRLRHVYLFGGQFKDAWLSPLAGATGLKALHVNSGVTGSFLSGLQLSKLEELDLTSGSLGNLDALAGCQALRRVRICACKQQEPLQPLLQLTRLEVLLLNNCDAADDSLVEGFKFTKLRALEISGRAKLTEAGLTRIAKFDTLLSLDLACQSVSSDVLIMYAEQLKQLAAIDLFQSGKPGEAAIDAWLKHGAIRSFRFDSGGISKAKLSELYRHLNDNDRKWSERNMDKTKTFKVGR